MNKCQIGDLPEMADSLSRGEIFWQRRNRVRRIIKRRLRYVYNLSSAVLFPKKGKETNAVRQTSKKIPLHAGDVVRVRSRQEIQMTLDNWNQFRKCSFMEEMWRYCGTSQRVLKRVEKFLDERDYLLKKCKGIIILENVFCEGTRDFGACDRTCFFFWREEWLEKIANLQRSCTVPETLR